MVKNIIIIALVLILSFVSLMYLSQRAMYTKASCAVSELFEITKIDYEYINHMNSIINKKVAIENVYKQILTLRERKSRLMNSSKCMGGVKRENELNQDGDVNTTTLTEMVNNKNIDAIMERFTPESITCEIYPSDVYPRGFLSKENVFKVCEGKAKGHAVLGYRIGWYETEKGDVVDDGTLREILTKAITDKFFKIDYETKDTLSLVSIDNSKEKIVFVSSEKDKMKRFSGFFFQGFDPINQR